MDRTLILIKPPAYKRGVWNAVKHELESNGLCIFLEDEVLPTREQAEEHYIEHKRKPFYEKIVSQLCSGKIIKAIVSDNNKNTIEYVRKIIGATDPLKAEPGTIRAIFGRSVDDNVIHASDSVEAAKREIGIWFN